MVRVKSVPKRDAITAREAALEREREAALERERAAALEWERAERAAALARRAAVSLPAALSRREAGNRRRRPKVPRQLAEEALGGMVATLTAKKYSFAVMRLDDSPVATYDPAAFFEWCRSQAWGMLAREALVIKSTRKGQRMDTWILERHANAKSGRTTVAAVSSSAWDPHTVTIDVYRDRQATLTVSGANDTWVAAVLLVLDSSGLNFVREGARITRGFPGTTATTLLRGWFTF